MLSNGYKAAQDTLILNNYVFESVGAGDAIVLEFAEDLTNMDVTVANQVILARNFRGQMASLTIIVPIGSSDDLQMETWTSQVVNDFVNAPFLEGTYSRITANTAGNLMTTSYSIVAGVVKKITGLKTNSTGDTTQALATWEINCLAARKTS